MSTDPTGTAPGADTARPAPVPATLVPWWRRGLAALAVTVAVLATVWVARAAPAGAAGSLVAFLIVIPLFTGPRQFGRVCLGVAVTLVPLAVLGVFLAYFIYLPVAVILLLAWLADPGARPRLAPLIASAGCLAAVAMTVVWAVALARGS